MQVSEHSQLETKQNSKNMHSVSLAAKLHAHYDLHSLVSTDTTTVIPNACQLTVFSLKFNFVQCEHRLQTNVYWEDLLHSCTVLCVVESKTSPVLSISYSTAKVTTELYEATT